MSIDIFGSSNSKSKIVASKGYVDSKSVSLVRNLATKPDFATVQRLADKI